MKKILLILSIVSTIIVTGCENENTSNPQPLGKATISGTVYADFDYTVDGYDLVKNKSMVVAVYDDNGSVRFFETSTNGEGKYSIEVEVGNRPLEVELAVNDFEQEVNYGGSTKEKVIFYSYGFNTDVYVVKGGQYIRDIYYND